MKKSAAKKPKRKTSSKQLSLRGELSPFFKLLKKAKVRNETVGCYGTLASLDGRYPYVYMRDLA
jgi:hypothetical protein